jgi:hypothetical protein
MKHIQNFSGFLTSSFGDLNEAKGEKITSAEIEKLVGMKATEEDYELDPEDVYKSVQSFVLENPAIDEDSPLYINIYDGDSFAFFVGSSPIALSIHSPAEKRSIQTTMVEIPAPLSKLDKAIVDEAVNVAIENS